MFLSGFFRFYSSGIFGMASFVQEVLMATGRLGEKEDYSAKAARLRSSIDDLKVKNSWLIMLRVG